MICVLTSSCSTRAVMSIARPIRRGAGTAAEAAADARDRARKAAGVLRVVDAPRPVIGGHQRRASLHGAQIGHALGADRHRLPAAGELTAVRRRRARSTRHPETIKRRSSAPSDRPVSRSSTAETAVSFNTRARAAPAWLSRSAREDEERRAKRRRRFETNRAAGLKAGITRPRTRSPPARPDKASSPSIDGSRGTTPSPPKRRGRGRVAACRPGEGACGLCNFTQK